MESKRQRQTGETIKRHFSIVLQQEGTYIYDTQALVTITEVKMSPDMGLARIYLSVFNVDDKLTVLQQLREEQTRLRQLLAHRVRRHLRRVPQIDFYLDDMIDEMYRVDGMFDRLHEDNQMGEEE